MTLGWILGQESWCVSSGWTQSFNLEEVTGKDMIKYFLGCRVFWSSLALEINKDFDEVDYKLEDQVDTIYYRCK